MLPQIITVYVFYTLCSASPLEKRSVTCLKVGNSATASWTNSADQLCTFTGVVGSNYGTNSAGSGE